MKNIFKLFIVLVSFSCKKNYTCTCTYSYISINYGNPITTSTTNVVKTSTIYDSKTVANKVCTGKDQTNANPNISCALN